MLMSGLEVAVASVLFERWINLVVDIPKVLACLFALGTGGFRVLDLRSLR